MKSFECELPPGGELQVLRHLVGLRAKLTIRPTKGKVHSEDWTIKLTEESSWATVSRQRDLTHLCFSSVAIFDYVDERVSRNEDGFRWIWPVMGRGNESQSIRR
jgi:hypothetical protein